MQNLINSTKYQSVQVNCALHLPSLSVSLNHFLPYLFSSSCKHLSVSAPHLPHWWWREPGWLNGCLPSSASACPLSSHLHLFLVLVLYYLASPALLLTLEPVANSPNPCPSHPAVMGGGGGGAGWWSTRKDGDRWGHPLKSSSQWRCRQLPANANS